MYQSSTVSSVFKPTLSNNLKTVSIIILLLDSAGEEGVVGHEVEFPSFD